MAKKTTISTKKPAPTRTPTPAKHPGKSAAKDVDQAAKIPALERSPAAGEPKSKARNGKTAQPVELVMPGSGPAPARTDTSSGSDTQPSSAKRSRASEGRGGGLSAAFNFLLTANDAMRVKDLTEAIIKKGLWNPKGKTPHATLAAAIGREIKDKGKDSRFKKTGRGLFAAARAKA